MKKFLSLVLALVMTMSLVTISAGAKDFTDNSKIKYTEAVDVVSELKIVDGYKDGTFNPTGTLTRGAAAKIICNLLLGPTTAGALSADTAPYKDVPANHEFAGYIAYCAQQGIISGYADGTFRPTGTLTGYAFMKMLLGALGYDATIEGYTGANWSVNVAKQALGIELEDGNDNFVGVQAVTREEAALYALNTLKADMVEYDSKTEVNVNGAVVTIGNSKAKEMEQGIYKDNLKEEGLQFAEKYFTDLKLSESHDDFLRPANKWSIKSDEIGTYAKTPDAVYEGVKVRRDTLYRDLDLSDPYDFDVVVDGVEATGTEAGAAGGKFYVAKRETGSFKISDKVGTGNGNLIEVYNGDADEDEDKVIVIINEYLMQVDGDYDEEDDELYLTAATGDIGDADVPNLNTDADKLSIDDFANLKSFKDEDYVLVTVADGEVKSIKLAEKVTAAVTEYVQDDTVTAGGTEYALSAKCGSDIKNAEYDLKEDYDLYLDSYGNVIWVDGVEAEGSYVYITEVYTSSSSSTSKIQAQAYFLDGTDDEITIDKLNGSTVKGVNDLDEFGTKTGSNAAVGKWYKYSLKDNGKYNLTDKNTLGNVSLTNTYDSGTVTNYDDNGVKIYFGTGANDFVKGNATTRFVIINKSDDVKVYTGIKNVPDTKIGGTGAVRYYAENGYAKYVFIDVGDTGVVKGGSSSSDFIYLYKFDKMGTNADDNDYYRFKAVVNGTVTKVSLDDGYIGQTDLVGKLYGEVSYDSDKYVTDMTEVNGTDVDDSAALVFNGTGTVEITQKNRTVTFSGNVSDSFYLDSGAKIFVFEGTDDPKTVSASKLVNDYSDEVIKSVYAVEGDDGYTMLFVQL